MLSAGRLIGMPEIVKSRNYSSFFALYQILLDDWKKVLISGPERHTSWRVNILSVRCTWRGLCGGRVNCPSLKEGQFSASHVWVFRVFNTEYELKRPARSISRALVHLREEILNSKGCMPFRPWEQLYYNYRLMTDKERKMTKRCGIVAISGFPINRTADITETKRQSYRWFKMWLPWYFFYDKIKMFQSVL